MKLIIFFGTRPEIIRLSELIKVANLFFDVIVCNTNQNFDESLNKIFLDDLGVGVDVNLFCNNSNTDEFIASVISEGGKFLDSILGPKLVVFLGDTNSGYLAVAAKKRFIPVVHLEAGNRSYDQRVPEEFNRKIFDHASDFNIAYSEKSYDNLIREGLSPQKCFVSGSPLKEVYYKNSKKINNAKILEELNLSESEYILLSCHRAENVSSKKFRIFLNELSVEIRKKFPRIKLIVTGHPHLKKYQGDLSAFFDNSLVLKPFGYFDYIKLQKNAFVVISDSGSISEESLSIGFRALNIRNSQERFEAFERGVPLVGANIGVILQYLEFWNSCGTVYSEFVATEPPEYDVMNFSYRCVCMLNGIVSMLSMETKSR